MRHKWLAMAVLGVVLAFGTVSWGEVTVTKVAHAGWKNCHRIANGKIDAIVTADVGPRVIRFGFVGGPNEFHQFPDQVGRTRSAAGGDEWRIYGGHRLWHAPEAMPRSYAPDNRPIEVRHEGAIVRCIQPVEQSTGIQKEIVLTMDPTEARMRVTHRLTNRGLWPVRLAPWALSVMETGGCAILPLPTTAPQGKLLPNARVILWSYSDMADPRFTWSAKYVLFRQDSEATSPGKVGIMATDGWGAYANRGHLFVKTFTFDPEGEYPDMGSSLEVYSASDFLELETVAPLTMLGPGETVEHVEVWHLFDGVRFKPDPRTVDSVVLPLVKPLLSPTR